MKGNSVFQPELLFQQDHACSHLKATALPLLFQKRQTNVLWWYFSSWFNYLKYHANTLNPLPYALDSVFSRLIRADDRIDRKYFVARLGIAVHQYSCEQDV